MKKKLLTIILLLILSFSFSATVFADTTAKKLTPQEQAELESKSKLEKEHVDLKNLKFNVNDVLTIEGQKTEDGKVLDDQAYLKDKNPIVNFILRVIDFATTVMGSVAVIILIVAGFMFMFAQGNQQQIDEAKEVIKYAFIGLALTFFSYIITIFIQSLFIATDQDGTSTTTDEPTTYIEQTS